jgi:hypothetical protein
MRSIAWLPVLALFAPVVLAACGPTGVSDYFNLVVDGTWHFDVIQPETDEFWTLQTLDADDNEESHRGEIFFKLTRTIPDGLGPGQDQTFPQRQFNVSHDQDLSGTEPISLGWEYKWVAGLEEGDHGEYFVLTPDVDPEWEEFWNYATGEEGGSDFEHDVTARYCDQVVQTSYGLLEDCIIYERSVTTTNYIGQDEQVLTTVHTETWAANIGLVRYEILASDGETTIAVLRTTDAHQTDE